MTVSFNNDAETTNGTAGTSVVIARPVGANVGDLLLAFVDATGTPTITAPAGWNPIGSQDSTGMRSAAYWRAAAASDPASWTWTLASSQRNLGYIAALPGANLSNPILDFAVTADTTAGTLWTASPPPEITTGAGAVGHAATVRTASGAATTWTVNSATERADLSTNAGAGTDIAGAVTMGAYTGVPAGVFFPTFTSSQSCTAGVIWAITIRPAFIGYDSATLAVPIVRLALGADPDGDPEDWTWTDVTKRVTGAGVSMSAGAQDAAGQSSATRITLAFNNADGTMAPDNPNSIFYPYLREDLPIQVSVPYGYGPDTELATAFVAKFTETWDRSEDHAIVSVEAQGRWDRVQGKYRPVRSVLYRTITGPSPTSGSTPHAYYPCEDDSGSSRVASALPGHQPLQVSGPVSFGGASDLAGSQALPTMGVEAVLGGALGPAYAPTGQWAVTVALRLPETEPVTEQRLMLVVGTGTAREWSLWLVPGSPAGLAIRAATFGSSLLDDGISIVEADLLGKWRLYTILVRQDGADIDWEAWSHGTDAGVGNSGTLAGRTIGVARTGRFVTFAGLDGMGIGHLALYTNPAFTSAELGFIAFAALDGQADETPAERWIRVAAEEGLYATAAQTADATEITMGAQPVGKLADILREAEAVDQGLIHDNGHLGQLVLVTRSSRYNATVSMTIDNGLQRLARGFEPTLDASERIAQAIVKRAGGSSATYLAAERGREDEQTYNLHTDQHLYEIAGWRANAANTRGRRYTRIGFDLRKSPELLEAWLNTSIGDRAQAINLPAIHAPSGEVADGFIQGYSQLITGERWTVDLVCTPARPYEVPVLESGDPETTWRLDMEGSTLAAAAGTSDTSLLVACSGDARWGTVVPYDLDVNGERMTATAVASSVTDTFTRTTANGWGTATSGQPWTPLNGSASDYSVSSNAGRITNNSTGVLRGVLLDAGSTDVDFSIDLVFPNASSGTSTYERYIIARATDTANHYGLLLQLGTSGGTLTMAASKRVGGSFTNLASKTAGTNAAGNTWRARVQIIGVPGSTTLYVTARNLTAGTPQVALRVPLLDDPTLTGTSIGVIDRRNVGNTDGAIVGVWDNLDVTMPQTITVTRGVAGGATAKAHTAGEPVRLWRARGVAL